MNRSFVRVLLCAFVLASLSGLAPAGTRAATLADGPLAVLPPRVPPVLESVDVGIQEWLRERLAASGAEILQRRVVAQGVSQVRASGVGDRPLHGSDAPALAAATGAWGLVYTQARFEGGRIDLRLRVHEGQGGVLVAGSRVEGALSDLGSLLEQALGSVLTVTSMPKPPGAAVTPRLSDLGRYERAVAQLERVELAGAWRELQGLDSPTAESIRRQVRATGNLESTPVSERSRLASASGVQDRAWLQVRQGLTSGANADLLMAGADAALAREDPDVAHRLYSQAAELAPDRRDAHLGRGQAAWSLGQVDEARDSFEQAVALEPDDPMVHEALGSLSSVPAAQQAQHLATAGRLRAKRLESGPAERNFRASGDLDGGILTAAQRNVAAMNERMGLYDEALLGYEEAAAQAPDDPELMAGLGRARARAGDLDGAQMAFGKALEVDADHPPALTGMGHVLTRQEKPAEAVPLLERAVAARSHRVESRKMLALAYEATGNPDAALATLTAGEVPTEARAELLVEASRIQREEGRLEDAVISLSQAEAIEPDDPPLHAALAELYEAQGDPEAAAAARHYAESLQGKAIPVTSHGDVEQSPVGSNGTPEDFARLFSSFPFRNPETRRPLARVHYLGVGQSGELELLAKQWLHPFTPDITALDAALLEGMLARYEVVPPPEVLPEVLQGASERLFAFGTAREDIALLNDVLGVDATFVAQLERVPEGRGNPLAERYVVRVRMIGGRGEGAAFIRANEMNLPAEAPFRLWNLRASIPLGLLLIVIALPLVRGWGSVLVKLDWETDTQTKGFFSVQISRKPGRAKRDRAKDAKSKAAQYQRRTRSWSRFARSMVGHETRFRMVPAGVRYVSVHGLLQDEQSREVIGNYLEERRIELRRGQALEIAFDFKKREAALEVRIVAEEGAELPQLPVALRGRPDTLRYMRDGATLFHVGNGQQGVLVGEEDRVHDVDVLVSDYHAALVTIQLGNDDTSAFTGCPDAVDPYLHGDMAAASAALDRAGQVEVANLLRARFHEERGESQEAARFYEAAGEMTQAAIVAADSEAPDLSASRFEEAGDFGRAAEKYAEAGDALKAAEALEAAYDYEGAIEAYRNAGVTEKVLELLEKTGGYYEAGTLACEAGDSDRAIRLLQMVDLRDPDYGETCRLLSEIFLSREEFDLAVHKAEEAMQVVGESAASLELHEQLARALERCGRTEDSLTAWETIRKRDAQYPEAAENIQVLRDRLAETATRADGHAATQIGRGSNDTAAVTAATGPAGDRYEILDELGRGGMGIVFRARDTRLGRVVALKRLPDNLRDHPTAVQLFLREARAAAALNHPNIVTLFDADQSADGNYYLTMELLEGLPLDAILERRGKLGAKDTLRLAVQIATGLQFAHEKKVIHRDIKTSNLFFTQDKVVKIMDFGLAKMTEEVRRAATVIGGTPYYMAPEQSEGKGVDHRADLYAFGVTMFELLTGTVPFKEGDVTYHHRHTPPPDPRSLAPEIPAPLAELILRLMEKRPDDRFARSAEVSEALNQLVRSL